MVKVSDGEISMSYDKHNSQAYGQRCMNAVIDEIAFETPDKPFLSLARSSDPAKGFDDISYGAFARAVDRCAYWIEEVLGRSTSFQPLLALLWPHDIRHALLVLACVKTGHCVSHD